MQENKNTPLVEEEVNFYNDPRKRSALEVENTGRIELKKIGHLTSIMLVIASTIGSGIFFTNGSLFRMAAGDMYFVLASWGVAILGFIALAFALLEIVSAQRTNRGILDWTKNFTPSWFHDSVKKYFRLVYVPLTLYGVTLMSTEFMQDAGFKINNGYLVALLAFGILSFFMIVNLVSFEASVGIQWLFKSVQVLAMLAIPIVAFVNADNVSNIMDREIMHISKGELVGDIEAATGFAGISKWMIIWGGIPVIAYSFEGFYIPSSLRDTHQTHLQNGRSIWIGVVFIASLYLFFSIGMIVGSTNGTVFGIEMASWLRTSLNVLISIGVLTIANGFIMSALRQMQASLKGSLKTYDKKNNNIDMKFLHSLIFGRTFMYNSSMNKKTFITSWTYLYIITTMYFLILTPIGIELYYNVDAKNYTQSVKDNISYYGTTWFLYEFATSMLAFVCQFMLAIIASVLVGGIVNRKTGKVRTIQHKSFIPLAIIAIVIQYLGFIYLLISTISDASGAFGATNLQQYNAAVQISIFAIVTSVVFGASLLNTWITNIRSR